MRLPMVSLNLDLFVLSIVALIMVAFLHATCPWWGDFYWVSKVNSTPRKLLKAHCLKSVWLIHNAEGKMFNSATMLQIISNITLTFIENDFICSNVVSDLKKVELLTPNLKLFRQLENEAPAFHLWYFWACACPYLRLPLYQGTTTVQPGK